ncbi:MAG TPA: MlaD family protein [Polyangiaceae bacterium]|nr:MlaD family protein [Polyangiaceae bacterium]
MTPEKPPEAQANVHRHVGFSWIWLLPLATVLLVGYLVIKLLSDRGPMISISFESADGLTAQQTQVKYKAVTLGTVEQIDLADDLDHVIVKVRMSEQSAALLTDKARFWVARPRLGGGLSAVETGLETLVSGAYVAVDPGPKGGQRQTEFKGLEKPPSVRSDEPGSAFFLQAETLGGLGEGAPVFYRDVAVGEVLSADLDDKSPTPSVRVRIFVRAPYDRKVVPETRFWNSSGIRVNTGASGLRIELQSFKSLLSGGIAFRAPPEAERQPRSPSESTFRLYADEPQAAVGFYSEGIPYVSYFQSSVRGLSEGSQVQMFGRQLGSVMQIDVVKDPRPGHRGQLAARVAFVLQPERALGESDRQTMRPEGMRALVREQMRVVLASSSLLTGQKELSLQFVPGSKVPPALSEEAGALVLPSEGQDLQDLSGSLSQILNKVNSIPFEEIGSNASHALASLDRTVGGPELQRAIASLDETLKEVSGLAREAKTNLAPALARLPRISEKLEGAVDQAQAAFGQSGYGSDSKTQRSLERMMTQVGDAARSIRLLADYLNRHPESVVSGRRENEP